MKKLFCVFAFLFLALPARAQLTTVSGTVKGTDGILYGSGQIKMQLVTTAGSPVSGQPTVTINNQAQCVSSGFGSAPCQVPFQGTVGPLQLSPTGTFTINLQDNTQITPAATQWLFTANSTGAPPPLGTGPQVCILQTTISGASQSLVFSCPNLSNASSGGLVSSAIPGTPGVTAVPIQSGLMAEYRILPSETSGALVDYSGNNNNATGTVGTPPTILAGTGGITMNFNGAVTLPAALNAAKTIMLFLKVTGFGSIQGGSPIFGNGGSLANVSGLMWVSSTVAQGANGPGLPGPFHLLSTNGNDQLGAFCRAAIKGNTTIAWVMDTLDTFYINGIPMALVGGGGTNGGLYAQPRSMAGVQTSGVFQLGGINAAHYSQPAANGQFAGSIYYAVFYNRVLTASEISANTTFINNIMATRGVPPSVIDANNTSGDTLVLDGDSTTTGCCSAPGNPYSNYTVFQPAGSWNVFNQGEGGMFVGGGPGNALPSTAGLVGSAGFTVDPLYAFGGNTRNAVVIWGGINDNNATISEPGVSGYCRARRLFGWKCFAVTLMSKTGADAYKNTFDTWLRQNWKSFADSLIDIGSDPLLGADGASGNATWSSDGTHPTIQGYANLVAPIMQRGVNRFYGNNDFSTATTYSSPATAAVATTAGSMSGNTATITFAATPANCQVGNQIVLAGITPAGYNSPAGHAWQILTQTATQITFYNSVSGLGAITVQGTGVCTQQQDADTYSILNFGAGNFTLETCMGFTGQNLYIRNINAAASTLVPFGSETITGGGATPTTLAANTTAILQAQLVSSSASGCNWVRIQ